MARAGLRRYAGTDYGDSYGRVLSWAGAPETADPSVSERTVGDYLDPQRPGSATTLVNTVSRVCGVDAAGWTWPRIVNMAAGVEQERKAQANAGG